MSFSGNTTNSITTVIGDIIGLFGSISKESEDCLLVVAPSDRR
jgi:hypothetical protein